MTSVTYVHESNTYLKEPTFPKGLMIHRRLRWLGNRDRIRQGWRFVL